MNGNQRIDILKIKEAAERAQACGMSVSEYTIRRAIRTGQLPCRIHYSKYLRTPICHCKSKSCQRPSRCVR